MKVFHELQKITQWYIWIVPICVFLIWLTAFTAQVFLDIEIGTKPATNMELTLIGILPTLILILLSQVRLTTVINSEIIKISLFPFCTQEIKLNDISNVDFIKYDFVGFGCRFGTKYGVVYNLKGNLGCHITTKQGKRFLLGTQKVEALKNHFNENKISYNFQIK
ncbi:MAG TPA: hypothetical protein PKD51_11795 [Saprospiraceae bacterium]|nr:hypothetical protein [Saprospiraceae bacterium]